MPKESLYLVSHDINGKRAAKELKQELGSLRGVLSVSVNTEKDSLAVDFDNTGISRGQLESRLKNMGYQIEASKAEEHIM